MIRQSLSFFVVIMLFFGESLQGQTDTLLTDIFASPMVVDDFFSGSGQKVIAILPPGSYYIYNDNQDTIFFDPLGEGMFTFCDSLKILDSIQIDGEGRKEIIFYRFCNSQISQHGGTYDITGTQKIGRYEIWNIDTKTRIFSANPYYYNRYQNFYAYHEPKHQKGLNIYHYKIKIDEVGVIRIKHQFKVGQRSPDLAEGRYIYQKGKYEKMEETD